MSLKAIYQEFLDSPNPLSLASNASLNYITTLTTFTEPGPIVKHLEVQNRMVVKKKAEKIIGAVVGHDSLSVDVETTLAFISGGGAYLPGMDGSFLVEKVTTLPMVGASDLQFLPFSVEDWLFLLTSPLCTNTLCRITPSTSITTTTSDRSEFVGTRAPY